MVRRDARGLSVLLLLGTLALSACKEGQSAAPPEPRPVRVATVKLEPADDTVRYPAVIRPRSEADVGFRVAGKVVARLAEVGTRVEAGTPLARLDPADIQLQVRASQAQLESARADAANARSDHQRYAKLRQGEWTTRQEADRRRTALEKAEARVREIEAQLRVLNNSLQYTTLLADAPGVVTSVLAEPGQVVAQGQTAFRIAKLGEVEAVANIPEQQVAGLPQRALSVELWAQPGLSIPGSLREVSPSADPGTRTYQARVTLTDPSPGVQLGMTATLVARFERGGAIARLPLSAVTQSGAAPAVWVVAPGAGTDGDRLELRPVAVAAYAGDLAIVADGLKEGERVVTAGVHKLDAGQKVRIWAEPGQ
ncbi:MAG TPA: efflux RND transporter periplasmic adaptor subunit [Azospirillum sp.]